MSEGVIKSADGESSKILVIAPEFPAINQPWIDTYLEQLIRHKQDPLIFTVNHSPKVYSEKVDRLGLLQKSIVYSADSSLVLKRFLTSKGAWRFLLNTLRHSLSEIPSWRKAVGDSIFSAWLLSVLHKNARIGIVHSHSETSAFRFLTVAKMLGVPFVVTFHGLPPAGVRQLDHKSRERLYQQATKVIVNTEFAQTQVCGLGCPPGKVQILPQGLPIEGFPFKPRSAPVSGECCRMLSVGRFHRDKGQHYALLALRRLLDAGIDVHHTFVGVGEGLSLLQRLAAKLGVSEKVTFLSGVSAAELLDLYAESHLFIFPSVHTPGGHVETQGVVLQEAQASGCIPIATRTGGVVECVNHEHDAFLVRQQSSRAIYEAVVWFLKHPERWPSFQRNGRLNVERNFSADVIGKRMTDLINNHKRKDY